MNPEPAWRESVLAGSTPLPSSPAVQCGIARIGGHPAVVASWNFANHGGSFGEVDADAFLAAVESAVEERLPLVSLLRSGGTRLGEGMRALVGIPRTLLALQRLRAVGVPHVSVADHPTMGGVWVSVASSADVRIAVSGALIGFSGPRAVLAMTGRELPEGTSTAAAAYDAGLVDAVVEPAEVLASVGRILAALAPDDPAPVKPPPTGGTPLRDGWDQVLASRTGPRPAGRELLDELLSDAVPLHSSDTTVDARIGRIAGRRAVVVALAATRSTMPTPAGFQLLHRAAGLAGALDLALIVLIDTPGADPHTEAQGLSGAIGEAMTAVLDCQAPTVSLVHGEGGSGGALAGAVTDVVGVGADGWFAALAPEGAAATLRIDASDAAGLMRITPADLLADGFADDTVPAGLEKAWLAATVDRLRELAPVDRVARRQHRWADPLPHRH